MIVKELIEKLKEYPSHAGVYIVKEGKATTPASNCFLEQKETDKFECTRVKVFINMDTWT